MKIVQILILLLSRKRAFSRYLIELSGAGARAAFGAGAGAGAGSGAAAAIRICGSVEPEPKEIFSASTTLVISKIGRHGSGTVENVL